MSESYYVKILNRRLLRQNFEQKDKYNTKFNVLLDDFFVRCQNVSEVCLLLFLKNFWGFRIPVSLTVCLAIAIPDIMRFD